MQFYASGNLLDPVGRVGEVIGSGGGAYPVWTNHREGRVVGTPVRFLHHRSSTLALWVVGQADKQDKIKRGKCGFKPHGLGSRFEVEREAVFETRPTQGKGPRKYVEGQI